MEKEIIDLRGEKCPLNFVKIKLKLEELEELRELGETSSIDILEALVDADSCGDVVKSIKSEEYKIEYLEKEGEFYRLRVKKI